MPRGHSDRIPGSRRELRRESSRGCTEASAAGRPRQGRIRTAMASCKAMAVDDEEAFNQSLRPAQGQLSYLQIPALNVQRSAEFYARVFGWHIEHPHPGFDAPGLIGQWVTDRPPARDAGMLPWLHVDSMVDGDEAGPGTRRRGARASDPGRSRPPPRDRARSRPATSSAWCSSSPADRAALSSRAEALGRTRVRWPHATHFTSARTGRRQRCVSAVLRLAYTVTVSGISRFAPQRAHRIAWSAFDRSTADILQRQPSDLSMAGALRRQPGQCGDEPDEPGEHEGADNATTCGEEPHEGACKDGDLPRDMDLEAEGEG